MTLEDLISKLEHPLENCLAAQHHVWSDEILVLTSVSVRSNQRIAVPMRERERLCEELDTFLQANQKLVR